jgi:hypothetical protein
MARPNLPIVRPAADPQIQNWLVQWQTPGLVFRRMQVRFSSGLSVILTDNFCGSSPPIPPFKCTDRTLKPITSASFRILTRCHITLTLRNKISGNRWNLQSEGQMFNTDCLNTPLTLSCDGFVRLSAPCSATYS